MQYALAFAWILGLGLVGSLAADELPGGPSGALLTPADATGWRAGLTASFGKRKLEGDVTDYTFSVDRVAVRVGRDLADAATVHAELGGVRMGRDGQSGDVGLWAALGGALNLVRLDTRPPTVTTGTRSSLILGLDVDVAYTESGSLYGGDVKYAEVRGGPMLTYAVQWKEAARWQPYRPRAVSLKGGPVASWIDGDYGDDSLSAKQTVGVDVTAAFLFDNLWTGDIGVTFFDTGDAALTLGLGHRF